MLGYQKRDGDLYEQSSVPRLETKVDRISRDLSVLYAYELDGKI